jgi:hypothetical protein
MDSVTVLKKERDQLQMRVVALNSAIATLSGVKSSVVSNAKRRKISIALKKSWAQRKKKEGKKA